MGICCSKPKEDTSVSFNDISGKSGTTDNTQKKENKRYTQDPTIPRNNTAAGDSQLAGWYYMSFNLFIWLCLECAHYYIRRISP